MLHKISLANFRNFESKNLQFSKDITVIVGPNASGKTNILESVFLLATGKSFKAKIEEEMIQYTAQLSRVGGIVTDEGKVSLELVLTRGLIDVGTDNPEKVARKKLMVGGVSKRLIDFAGRFRVVLFGPWDMDLVTESPSVRRKFMDIILSQVDREYRRALLSYEKGLRQRNKLLYRIREEGISHSQLLFWNRLLIKNGDFLSRGREELINYINSTAGIDNEVFMLEYDRSAISESRIEQYKTEEVAAATTLIGPHRDDFIFKKADKELALYGSRGEQRMGVLWLKLAEMSYVKSKVGMPPTLLLDDIFSELDHKHREIVKSTVEGQQTIITTADPHVVVDFHEANQIEL